MSMTSSLLNEGKKSDWQVKLNELINIDFFGSTFLPVA